MLFMILIKTLGKKMLDPTFLLFRYFLSLKYLGLGIPKHQLASFFVLKRFDNICKSNKIETWVWHGTLLGAIRDQKFAGRPGDLDFLVSCEDYQRIMNLTGEDFFRKTSFIRWFPLFRQTYKVELHYDEVGAKFYRKVFVLGRLLQMLEIISLNATQKKTDDSYSLFTYLNGEEEYLVPVADFSNAFYSRIFGLQVRVPRNFETHLEALHGPDWRIPKISKTEVFSRKPYLWSTR
jgi:phosphorylcholine metabolism protein LicD